MQERVIRRALGFPNTDNVRMVIDVVLRHNNGLLTEREAQAALVRTDRTLHLKLVRYAGKVHRYLREQRRASELQEAIA